MSSPTALSDSAFDPWMADDRPEVDDQAPSALSEQNDLSACLWPLLRALNWSGHPRHVAEALPHFIETLDLTGFLNAMAVLGFRAKRLTGRLDRLDSRLMPCLFLPDDRPACVPLASENGVITVFDGAAAGIEQRAGIDWHGTAYVFSPADPDDKRRASRRVGWFALTTARFRSVAGQVLALTFLVNVLALATPLFIMAVYDQVVASHSLPTLAYLAIGVAIAILGDQALRTLRARTLAHVGARLDTIVSTAVFQKVLSLPPTLIERATVGAQLARLRDFESVRDFFTGPMGLVVLEVPFALIFIAVLAMIGGPVALVPLAMFAVFGVCGMLLMPVVRLSVARSANAGARRQEFLAQFFSGLRTVKYGGAEAAWQARFRDVSADAAMASFRMGSLSAVIGELSHVLMVGAGVATMVLGVIRVIDGAMTTGALIASMILVWRVLAPLQVAFVTISRLAQVQSSVAQIDNLMTLNSERDPSLMVAPLRKVQGRVSFHRVSFRYAAGAEPALVGVDFDVAPGEVCALVGFGGAGKSTVLRLILGMYQPQAGALRLDGKDIRQIDPVELRHLVAYQPQTPDFFYGTLAQNLRLAKPDATDEEIAEAAAAAGLLDAVLDLPDGFETRIGDARTGALSTSVLQQLNLARALVKRAPILLLDEPGKGLDVHGDQRLVATIERLRGSTTVFLNTHRPSHLKVADKILWLDRGVVQGFGPAEALLSKLPEDLR